MSEDSYNEAALQLLEAMSAKRIAIMQSMEAVQAALLVQDDAFRAFVEQQDEVNRELESNQRKTIKAMAKLVQQTQELEKNLNRLEESTAWMSQGE